MKGQMMIITAVIVSVMMVSVSSSVSQLGDRDYEYRDEAYITSIIKGEASQVDTRYMKERQNFQKMVHSIDKYTTEIHYWSTQECFNVTLSNRRSNINMICIS